MVHHAARELDGRSAYVEHQPSEDVAVASRDPAGPWTGATRASLAGTSSMKMEDLGSSGGTRGRILNAAFERVSEVGLAALTLEDVATSGGVSRQTVYRHFGSREGLVEALVLREERWFIDRVVSAAEGHRDASEAIAAGVSAAIVAASEHRLLQRLLATEPESILPLVVLGEGPVISAARPVVENLLATRLELPEREVVEMAEVCSRLLISYVLDPGPESPQAIGRRIARFVVAARGT